MRKPTRLFTYFTIMISFFGFGMLVFLLWRFSKNYNSTEPPTLPGKLPFLGHYLKFFVNAVSDSVSMFKSIKEMSKECENIGGVAKLYIGPLAFYFITDPEDCLTVSAECIEKHYIHDFMRPIFANGILVSDAATWKKNRKLLNPAFSQQVLDGFIGTFNNYANKLVEEFTKELGKPFDHDEYLRINNLQTICSMVVGGDVLCATGSPRPTAGHKHITATSFGLEAEKIGNLKQDFLPLIEEGIRLVNILIINFWYHSDFIHNLSTMKKKGNEIAAKINEFADIILQKKKAERKLKSATQNDTGKLKPFMDLILELADDNPDLTDEQIKGETNTVVIAGHETTASMLTFVLTVLGSNPDIQERAYKEIIEVLGDSKDYVDKDDLSKFVYIEAILKETMRLYPIVSVVMRQIDKDIKLKNFTLKAGYGCAVCLYGALRHPIWGPDTTEFRPERWLEKESLPPPQLYAAFGLGRRSCIGKVYAMMSMKITLVNVIRRFVISSDLDKMAIELKTVVRPAHGYYINLKLR